MSSKNTTTVSNGTRPSFDDPSDASAAFDLESATPGEIQLELENEEHEVVTDSEDEDEFIRKYGEIEFKYIKPPKESIWFIRPHALNYFKDGVLYRTKGERSSEKTELFLDLMYVGIVANLAGAATEKGDGAALLEYILLFIPAWTVWADIKDFTNYYYNEDLSQKLYIFWILVLLTLYANSHENVLESVSGAAYTIVPYMLARLSLAAGFFIYSLYIPEHRPQQRLYGTFLIITSCLWIPVIFIGTRAKIGVSIAIMVLEQVSFLVAFHPFTKKLLKVTMSTALNLEHEVERLSAFTTIAIGEYLYKLVASNPLGPGLSFRFARGVFLLIIAYCIFWFYNYGSTCHRATHALRNTGATAICWIYAHLPLIAAIVLSADAGGDLLEREGGYDEETEEASLLGLSFFFTGGICVAMCMIGVIGLLDCSRDAPDMHFVPQFWRVVWRIPIGVVVVCLSFAKLDITLLMGLVSLLLFLLLVYESVVMTPKKYFTLCS